ncbi:hypothetical protein F0562_010652 [Nyssa sinensis]|uniref:Uncharacterized protein n=1 Tax=Nyssa sinensis TaxID=561372 RepID=A0A5J5A1R3_9ASTE|nr:hypothetical protein F0562_010652 [Nyssa sinensis]
MVMAHTKPSIKIATGPSFCGGTTTSISVLVGVGRAGTTVGGEDGGAAGGGYVGVVGEGDSGAVDDSPSSRKRITFLLNPPAVMIAGPAGTTQNCCPCRSRSKRVQASSA